MYPQTSVNIVENYFLLDFEVNRFTNEINQVSTQLSQLGTFITGNPNALVVNNQGFISLIQKYKNIKIIDLLQNCFCGMIESLRFHVFSVFFAIANSNITV